MKTSSEESKQGLAIEEVVSFIQSLQEFDKIEVVGLMTMAPFTEEEEEIRRCFKELRIFANRGAGARVITCAM